MDEEKPDGTRTESDCKKNISPKQNEELEKLTSIVQIDDSELPQSVKDKFKG